jgi:hypothetical protein
MHYASRCLILPQKQVAAISTLIACHAKPTIERLFPQWAPGNGNGNGNGLASTQN